jgi:uncharacterized membrane protein
MTDVLFNFFAYAYWLIVIGFVLLLLGLVGLAIFGRETVSTELDDAPKLSEKKPR